MNRTISPLARKLLMATRYGGVLQRLAMQGHRLMREPWVATGRTGSKSFRHRQQPGRLRRAGRRRRNLFAHHRADLRTNVRTMMLPKG